ncbi:MAG: hypothetical protein ABJF63_21205, partial [Ekhidna sp.]
MRRIERLLFSLLIVGGTSLITHAQNGPGGIGDGTGTNGPRNVLWLDASTLGLGDGANVLTWSDLSGNGNDLTQQGADAVPTFAENAFGTGLDAIRFDGTERYLRILDNATLDGFADGVSIILVTNFSTVDDNPRGIISKRNSSSSEEVYSIFTHTGSRMNFDVRTTDDNRLSDATTLTASTDYILSAVYDEIFQYTSINSNAPDTRGETGNLTDASSDLILGALNNNYGTYFDGYLAEVIIYGNGLTQAERIVIENYLANKYSITLSGNDFWTDNATYSNGLAGIGQDLAYSSEATTASSDLMRISESTDFDDNDWVFWGHDNGDASVWVASEVPGAQQRLAREWLIEENGETGSVTVQVDGSELPSTGISNPQYYLLVDTNNDADFSDATPYLMISDGAGGAFVNIDLNTNDRIAISFEPGTPSQIWYSYISDDWSDPNTWTLDGAISPLYLNPSSEVPGVSDSVVINTGRTVTMDVNDVAVTRLEIIGTLDLVATTGHIFGVLDGSGTLRLSGAAGNENYPVTNDALFIDSDEGGTLEYYGAGLSVNSDRSANNLLINMINTTDMVTTLADFDLNGNLTISRGIFQFNDNLSTSNLNVTVDGNVLIESSGGIDVGTTNARHEFNLYGNFTNQGDVDFTNRTSQATGSEATNGIVDVNFLSSSQDQTVVLQNVTDFYRVEINKGVDDTYIVEFIADDPSFFNLYGYANQGIDNPQGSTNDNAFGLIYGTAKIGNNVTVSPLNAGGNYSIFEGAQIWVDGGTVEKTAGTAIVPYGSIRVSSGALNAPINSGITTRDNGQLTIEGGTVTVNQFRTSINGVSALGGLVMTGGIFNIIGENTSANYYTFSLTYPGNVFNMSGGVINVSGANATGGIYINSSDENISVTGGTVNLDVTNGNNLTITSRAPFFNLNVLESNASAASVLVSNGSSGTGGGLTTVNMDKFQVLNDLHIDNSGGNTTTFNAGGIDLGITGSLLIENGSSVDLSNMNLTFEGTGSSNIDIGIASTLVLDSLEINKNNENVNVIVTNGQSTAIQVDDLLNVASGNFDVSTFDITVNGNIDALDTIGTAISTGQIYMNGAATQSITSTNGAIYDLEIDNTNGVSLDGDFGIINQLNLNDGIFDINTSKLTTGAEVLTTGTFGTSLMIQTGGNPTDGGLEYLFDADETLTYPFGISGNYTPLVADINLTSGDVGYIRTNPVNDKLGTIDDGAGVIDFLNYYWKIGVSDFVDLPTVNSYVFSYSSADVSGTEGNLQPGFVEDGTDADLDADSFTRTAVGSTADVASNQITFILGTTARAANYTAGEADAFAGGVTVFYSRKQVGDDQKNWTSRFSWSTDDVNKHAGQAASSYPGENSTSDVAVVGFGGIDAGEDFNTCNPCTIVNSVRHDHRVRSGETITVAEIIFDQNPAANALSNNDTRIRVFETAVLNAARVTGRGTMFQRVNASNIGTINADFNEFNKDEDNGWFLQVTGGTSIVISDRFEFPTLRVFGGGRDVSYTQDVTAKGLVVDNNADLFLDHNFTINGTARIGLNGGGELIFGAAAGGAVGSNVIFECDSLILTSNNNNGVSVVDAGADIHTLRVNGGLNLVQGALFDLSNADPSSQAILELAGTGQHAFTNTSSIVPELYRIVVNKGVDTTSTFSLDAPVLISGDNSVEPPAVELQNGKLIINSALINAVVADGIDYLIPASAGVEVLQGTISTTGSNIILDGLLRVNGGTVNLGTSDIEYTNSGTSLIDVLSGTLNVGGQVRRATSSTTGILKYRQTGGDVDIATDGISTSSRGAFEVLNSGSEFTLTGGTFNIERGVTGDANISLELDPTTTDISGSTITIFENLGGDYGANFFNVSSSILLNDLIIANTIDLPDVQLFNRDLEVNNLTINANQSLLTNGFDLTLNGDFTNNGTYGNTNSETIFAGSGAQTISGSGAFTIFTLRKNGSGTTTSNVALDLDSDFYLTSGTFDVGSNSLSLQNDAFVQSTFLNSGGNGLMFNGTANQDLNGLTNNAIDIGTITINNPSGVDIPDGNGFDFNITQELRLNGGVFNIGGSLVTLSSGAPVTEVSTFNVNNMVQTNSSFTDNGLRIEFFTVAADTVVFFPIGELKYTPVEFDLDAGTTTGSIRVRPANEPHPTIVDDAEPMTETEIDDTQNVLNYHWIVVSENVTNASGSAIFFYDHDDISVTAPYDTTHYISARLLSNDVNWDKFAPTLFRGVNQTFEVPLSSFSASEITGDYTAGVGSSDGVNNDIEGAIPDQLAQYETSFAGTGNYSLASNWNPLSGSPTVTDGVGPVGAQIIVRSGDDLTLNLDNIRLYATEIEAGGILRVPSGTVGVRLGTVTGSGTIVLEDNELLPTGEYTDFFQCDGGALQYSGTTSYNVLSGISQVRKVILDGSGSRTLPNNLLTVCDTLEINGPTVVLNSGLTYAVGDADTDLFNVQAGAVILSNGSSINITGDFELSGGTFTGTENTDLNVTDDMTLSGGTLNWNGTDVTLNGSSEQLVDGSFIGVAGFDDLTINNSGTGVTVNSGDVEIGGTLTLTDGLVNTTSSETLTLTSSGDWTGASTASYVTGPMQKEDIAATSTYEFPVGKSVRYAPVSVVNVDTGGDDWTAEYYTSTSATYPNSSFDTDDPGSGFNALIRVLSTDRWEVSSAGSNSAQVQATYGSHNSFDNSASIRLVWWDDAEIADGDVDAAQARWENQGGQISGTASSGTVTSESSVIFSTRQVALGYAPETVLPVELLDFSAIAIENRVNLFWSTVTELNNDYFELFHSTDGVEFVSIGTVEGNGTTNELIEYGFTHEKPALGDNYYKLRQVDFDGTETFYDIVRVYNDHFRASMDVTIYPNPATNENLHLRIQTGDDHTP